MFIVSSYTLAVLFCFVTMICWGSWGNTQKLAGKSWRYELYYWDYTIGILLFALLLVFSLGSFGSQGRSFLEDIRQVSTENMVSAFVGGVIFNASNILFIRFSFHGGNGGSFSVGCWAGIGPGSFYQLL